METRKEKTKLFKELLDNLEPEDKQINLLWSLVNAKKINRRQFKELIKYLYFF